MVQQSDDPRVAGYLDGDSAVFEQVHDWLRTELKRSYPRLASEHDDLCLTVHGKLLSNLRAGKYEGRSDLRSYVCGIAHYTAIDRLRELYRERLLGESLARQPQSEAESPYGAVEARDEGDLIRRVLLALPELCRDLWRMVFLETLPYVEIGRRLAIPPGTVKSRMWHCRRKARSALRRLRDPRV